MMMMMMMMILPCEYEVVLSSEVSICRLGILVECGTQS